MSTRASNSCSHVDIGASEPFVWQAMRSPCNRNDIVTCCFAIQMVVPTADTVRFSYLLETCLDVGRNVLFTGVTGVGKSVITGAALHTLTTASTKNSSQASEGCGVAGRLVAHTLVFSAQTSSSDVQYLIESKLDKKRKKRYAEVARLQGNKNPP